MGEGFIRGFRKDRMCYISTRDIQDPDVVMNQRQWRGVRDAQEETLLSTCG